MRRAGGRRGQERRLACDALLHSGASERVHPDGVRRAANARKTRQAEDRRRAEERTRFVKNTAGHRGRVRHPAQQRVGRFDRAGIVWLLLGWSNLQFGEGDALRDGRDGCLLFGNESPETFHFSLAFLPTLKNGADFKMQNEGIETMTKQTRRGAVVKWLRGEVLVLKAVGSNPSFV